VNAFLHRGVCKAAVALFFVCGFACAAAFSQAPVDTSQPIVIKTIKPKSIIAKFAGTVMHANTAQITVRGKDNELAVRTFPLSPALSAAMQKVIDRGGFQYGDKVVVVYNPGTGEAVKIKGKPSHPI
jgi:hypothetical protein